jgi:competence protein ComEC
VRWADHLYTHPRHAVLFALTAGLLVGPLSRAATVALALVALATALVGPRGVALAAAAAVLSGGLVADVRLSSLERGALTRLDGRVISARAVVLEPLRDRPGRLAVGRVRLLDGPAAGDGAVLRVHAAVRPGVGEIVAVTGRVEPLGRYDAYQRRRGALAGLDVTDIRLTGARRGGVAGVVDGARRRAEAGLTRALAEPESALLRGMVLGEDERLSDEVRTEFKRSGLAHVLAVSGQNVMLLAMLVLGAGALVGVALRARLLVALALVALYVPLTGAGPSIQRAGVMGAAGLVAALAGRPVHRWYALGLAAAVTLALNPLTAGEPGWQLSFAAVAALLALAPPLREAFDRRVPGPVADAAAMTVAATVGTAPLMAMHFGTVSLASLPANLLAAAAIAPIMWLGMLAAAAAQIAPALAEPLNALNAPLLRFVEWVAHTMAGAPAAVLPVRIGSLPALTAAYAALGAVAVGLRSLLRRLPPPPPPGLRRPRIALAAGAAAAGAAAVLLATASLAHDAPPILEGDVVVSFLNIGQGDATLIQSGRASVLVDTGPPGGPIIKRLHEAGVKRLDGLVLTHAQTDHEGMALNVMRAFPTRLVVDGGAGWSSYTQRGLPGAVASAHARELDAHAGQVLRFGAMTMRILWPPPPGPAFRPEGDPNDRAIVALVRVGSFDLFLSADAESNVTLPLALPHVEAMKVAHHGSADAGLPALLERLQPQVAAIEVGRGNTYGHPTPSTLAALRVVPHVYRTDRDGTVRLRVHAGAMTVERGP